MQVLDRVRDPVRLVGGALGMVAAHGASVGKRGHEVLLEAHAVLLDQRVRHGEDLRRGAVVLAQVDGRAGREALVEVKQEAHVGAAPGVDGLVGVADDEEVVVQALEDLHELVLGRVDVLELVDHDVLEAALPLEADVLARREHVQREEDEVVVVEAEALLLLVEVAVEEDVLDRGRLVVLGLELLEREVDEELVVVALAHALAHLEHVARTGVGHVAQRDAALLVDDGEHLVDVGVVEHEEALGVAEGAGVLLKDADAEAVEGVDVGSVVVAGEVVDALAHLVGGLVGEGHAEDVAGHDAELVDEVGEAAAERAGLAGARARDHAHVALGGGDRLALGVVEVQQRLARLVRKAAQAEALALLPHRTLLPATRREGACRGRGRTLLSHD